MQTQAIGVLVLACNMPASAAAPHQLSTSDSLPTQDTGTGAMPGVAPELSRLSLAEAQAVTARRAQAHASQEETPDHVVVTPCQCRIPELVPGVATALGRLSLAEAQAVTAHRAELRGSSPALAAALHVATAGRLLSTPGMAIFLK